MKYIAYGSNLNKAQMSFRCRDAVPYKSGWLKDYRLVYRGSKTGFYATVIPCKGSYVPVGIWDISRKDEFWLDVYEGYPQFYTKILQVPVELEDGKTIMAMMYLMRKGAKTGRPSEQYIDTVYKGYEDFNLDFRFLADSLKWNTYELQKRKR